MHVSKEELDAPTKFEQLPNQLSSYEFSLQDAELESIIADGGDRLIVIDFYATWCGPCKMMGPKFEKLSDEHKAAMFVKIDVDEQEEISDSYDINVLPTFILIKNKEKLEVIEGNVPDELRKAIEKFN
ncbi:Thioredoxin-1 [Toxocara canis]|uniref:Thioredoxin-1 n=1 Tax=Toxocara canis TaxID=6265 RepID=A0A0B2VFU0_TOXCA|nr:Thioredoxin-1 [Toxocara canis]